MSLSRKCTGRLFQRHGPAAAKLLSPNVLCVHGTAHDLWVDEQSKSTKNGQLSKLKSIFSIINYGHQLVAS